MIFENRKEAGMMLASKLLLYKNKQSIILALPRGGVPVGFEVAKALYATLNVLVVRKIGLPLNPEFGIGAVSEGNVRILDKFLVKSLNISERELEEVFRKEEEELRYRIKIYRNNKPLPALKNKTVILIDDGLATGVTALAAANSVRMEKPKQIIFASPVCSHDNIRKLDSLVDKTVCLTMSVDLSSIAASYRNFEQINDQEVIRLLYSV
jgi:putative phosphoribosyl transferase